LLVFLYELYEFLYLSVRYI